MKICTAEELVKRDHAHWMSEYKKGERERKRLLSAGLWNVSTEPRPEPRSEEHMLALQNLIIELRLAYRDRATFHREFFVRVGHPNPSRMLKQVTFDWLQAVFPWK